MKTLNNSAQYLLIQCISPDFLHQYYDVIQILIIVNRMIEHCISHFRRVMQKKKTMTLAPQFNFSLTDAKITSVIVIKIICNQ